MKLEIYTCPTCKGLIKQKDVCPSCGPVTSERLNLRLNTKEVKPPLIRNEVIEVEEDLRWNGPSVIDHTTCPKCGGSYFKWYSEPKSDDEPLKMYYHCYSEQNKKRCGFHFSHYK